MPQYIKERIVEISKLMYSKGMANAYEGNVSVLHEGRVYITPSGVCKGFLSADMIVVTDLNGNTLEASEGYKASSELKLHLYVYRKRNDIRSVIHAHPPFSTAFAIANRPVETKAYPEMIVLFDKIPLAAYGRPSTDEIYLGMENYVAEYDMVLLANHGIVCYGKDAFDAFFKLEAAEGIAKTLAIAGIVGGEKELPPDKLEELYAMRKALRR